MSFVTYGARQRPRAALGIDLETAVLANSDGTPFSIGSTSAGAVGLATKATTIDPSVQSNVMISGLLSGSPTLSPFSSINLAYLTPTLGNALNAPLQNAADAIIQALPDKLMGTIGQVVSAVASAVPVVGTVVGIITSLVDMLGALSEQAKAADEAAAEGPACQQYLVQYAVTPTGGALDLCDTCPADLFFPSVIEDHSSDGMTVYAHDYRCMGGYDGQYHAGPNGEHRYAFRPALGQALMLLTEGSYFDPMEIAVQNRADFQNTVLNGYAQVHEMFGARLMAQSRYTDGLWWSLHGGIPYDRRMLFQQVRRGIQGSSKNYGHLSDAGLSLWPIYMDLLVAAYDSGQLNDEWIKYALTHLYCPITGAATTVDCNYWFGSPLMATVSRPIDDCAFPGCADALTRSISSMVQKWKNTVQNPGTANGWRDLDSYRQKAQDIAIHMTRPLVFQTGASMHPGFISHPKARTAPPSKFHPSAAVLGAGAAAAVIYFFL